METLPPLIALSEAYKNISFYRLSLNLIYDHTSTYLPSSLK